MKVIKTKPLRYKKGELYPPDAVADLPTACNQFFSDQEFQVHFGEHEYGTVRCIESFTIEWTIKHDFAGKTQKTPKTKRSR